jgi:TonB family protein
MRIISFALFLLFLTAGNVCAQNADVTAQAHEKTPNEILAEAAPLYDFQDPALHPWHVKVTYQLFDAKGKHSRQGTFEYWWVSRNLSRSTWIREGMSQTDWQLPGGQLAYQQTGEALGLFEYELRSALISPLPKLSDPLQYRVEKEAAVGSDTCLTVMGGAATGGSRPEQGPFPTYCFAAADGTLQSTYSFERLLTRFSDVTKVQGKYLAHEIVFMEGDRKLLSAHVDVVEEISASDAALTAPEAAARTVTDYINPAHSKEIAVNQEIAKGMALSRPNPDYPTTAKKQGIQGQVVLRAVIATDGRIHELRVVSAPSALLADASFTTVSRWTYRPYLLNGQPVPVETTITVAFALGR